MNRALVQPDPKREARALAAFGERLLVGWQAPCSPADGASLLEEAASKGDVRACLILAVIAATGLGRAQSWTDAYHALDRAAELEAPEALAQLAALRQVGLENPHSASQWIAGAQGRCVDPARRLRAFRGFLPAAFCDYLIQRARPRLVPVRANEAIGGGLGPDATRTNSSAVFTLLDTDVVLQLIRARSAASAGAKRKTLEPLEVLHYSTTERYRRYPDVFRPRLPTSGEKLDLRGQRVKAWLVCLSPDSNTKEIAPVSMRIEFSAPRGEALLFDDVSHYGSNDPVPIYAGIPSSATEKWLLAQWIRSEPHAGC